MAFLGMNTEQVKSIAKEVKSDAAQLDSMIKKVGSKIQGADWKGHDREQFVGEWNQHMAQFNRIHQMLMDTAVKMEKNATEQEQASR